MYIQFMRVSLLLLLANAYSADSLLPKDILQQDLSSTIPSLRVSQENVRVIPLLEVHGEDVHVHLHSQPEISIRENNSFGYYNFNKAFPIKTVIEVSPKTPIFSQEERVDPVSSMQMFNNANSLEMELTELEQELERVTSNRLRRSGSLPELVVFQDPLEVKLSELNLGRSQLKKPTLEELSNSRSNFLQKSKGKILWKSKSFPLDYGNIPELDNVLSRTIAKSEQFDNEMSSTFAPLEHIKSNRLTRSESSLPTLSSLEYYEDNYQQDTLQSVGSGSSLGSDYSTQSNLSNSDERNCPDSSEFWQELKDGWQKYNKSRLKHSEDLQTQYISRIRDKKLLTIEDWKVLDEKINVVQHDLKMILDETYSSRRYFEKNYKKQHLKFRVFRFYNIETLISPTLHKDLLFYYLAKISQVNENFASNLRSKFERVFQEAKYLCNNNYRIITVRNIIKVLEKFYKQVNHYYINIQNFYENENYAGGNELELYENLTDRDLLEFFENYTNNTIQETNIILDKKVLLEFYKNYIDTKIEEFYENENYFYKILYVLERVELLLGTKYMNCLRDFQRIYWQCYSIKLLQKNYLDSNSDFFDKEISEYSSLINYLINKFQIDYKISYYDLLTLYNNSNPNRDN